MELKNFTQAEAFNLAIETARAVCRGESEVDRNNVIVMAYRRCDRDLRASDPTMFDEGADMESTVSRLEAMTLASWMQDYVPEDQRPIFIATCQSRDIDLPGC